MSGRHLTDPEVLRHAFSGFAFTRRSTEQALQERAGDLTCATCGGTRTVDLLPVFSDHRTWTLEKRRHASSTSIAAIFGRSLTPLTSTSAKLPLPWVSLAKVTCRQCASTWAIALVSEEGPDDAGYVLLLGRSTLSPVGEYVPESVASLLTEAARCQRGGAHLAALAMFRATVEAVLSDQGVQGRMLGQKMKELERTMLAGNAPPWATALQADTIKALKDLGNWAIHSDEPGRNSADMTLSNHAAQALATLIDAVYEAPARQRHLVQELRPPDPALARDAPPTETEDS